MSQFPNINSCKMAFTESGPMFFLPPEGQANNPICIQIPASMWERIAQALKGKGVFSFTDLVRWAQLGVAYAVLVQKGTAAEQAAVRGLLEKEVPNAWDAFTEGGVECVRTWIIPLSPQSWYSQIWPKLKAELKL